MSKIDDGSAAFPGKQSPDYEAVKLIRDETGLGMYEVKELLSHNGGMSLRDYFAGQALAGLAANPSTERSHSKHAELERKIAFVSYRLADAMLAARKEPTNV